MDVVARVAGPLYPYGVTGGLLLQIVGLVMGDVLLGSIGLILGAGSDLATSNEESALRGQLRRIGIGVVQRMSVRALLLLGLVAQSDLPRSLLIFYPLAIGLVIASARLHQLAMSRSLRDAPPLGVRSLTDDLGLTRYFDEARRRRTIGVGSIVGLELPAGLGLLVGTMVDGGLLVPVTLLGASVLVALTVASWHALRAQRFIRSDSVVRYREALWTRIESTGAEIVVYFSGDQDATYQLNQWVEVFERLERPVLYLLRERVHERAMLPTRWPVVVSPRHADVEVVLAADPKVVLYVGNAGRNIHFLRYARPRHVFLNHGDSDKISSANPVVKTYDKLFVAGELAVERYRAAGVDLPDDRFVIVGRPQLDGVLDRRRRVGDGPPTLLYAPTWEGYFEAADYSSVERQGVELVRRLLAHGDRFRVVFKPHPMSGLVRPGAAAAVRRIESLLREAGAPHVIASDHPDLDLLAWFDRSDVLVSDVSAVITDFLYTDKPYLVTNPRGLSPEGFRRRFPSHTAAYVVDPALADLGALVAAAFGDDPLRDARVAVKRRVLGDHPGGPMAAFQDAIEQVRAEAIAHAATVRNTFSYGD